VVTDGAAVPLHRHMAAFLRLELRRATRNRRYLVIGMAFPVFFYLL
jgi:hypothetical protein